MNTPRMPSDVVAASVLLDAGKLSLVGNDPKIYPGLFFATPLRRLPLFLCDRLADVHELGRGEVEPRRFLGDLDQFARG
jgi:hypothetical protein